MPVPSLSRGYRSAGEMRTRVDVAALAAVLFVAVGLFATFGFASAAPSVTMEVFHPNVLFVANGSPLEPFGGALIHEGTSVRTLSHGIPFVGDFHFGNSSWSDASATYVASMTGSCKGGPFSHVFPGFTYQGKYYKYLLPLSGVPDTYMGAQLGWHSRWELWDGVSQCVHLNPPSSSSTADINAVRERAQQQAAIVEGFVDGTRKIFVAGGRRVWDASFSSQSNVGTTQLVSYTPSTNTFDILIPHEHSESSTFLLTAKAQAALLNGKLFYFGGEVTNSMTGGISASLFYADVTLARPNVKWVLVSATGSLSPRYGGGAWICGSTLFVARGYKASMPISRSITLEAADLSGFATGVPTSVPFSMLSASVPMGGSDISNAQAALFWDGTCGAYFVGTAQDMAVQGSGQRVLKISVAGAGAGQGYGAPAALPAAAPTSPRTVVRLFDILTSTAEGLCSQSGQSTLVACPASLSNALTSSGIVVPVDTDLQAGAGEVWRANAPVLRTLPHTGKQVWTLLVNNTYFWIGPYGNKTADGTGLVAPAVSIDLNSLYPQSGSSIVTNITSVGATEPDLTVVLAGQCDIQVDLNPESATRGAVTTVANKILMPAMYTMGVDYMQAITCQATGNATSPKLLPEDVDTEVVPVPGSDNTLTFRVRVSRSTPAAGSAYVPAMTWHLPVEVEVGLLADAAGSIADSAANAQWLSKCFKQFTLTDAMKGVFQLWDLFESDLILGSCYATLATDPNSGLKESEYKLHAHVRLTQVGDDGIRTDLRYDVHPIVVDKVLQTAIVTFNGEPRISTTQRNLTSIVANTPVVVTSPPRASWTVTNDVISFNLAASVSASLYSAALSVKLTGVDVSSAPLQLSHQPLALMPQGAPADVTPAAFGGNDASFGSAFWDFDVADKQKTLVTLVLQRRLYSSARYQVAMTFSAKLAGTPQQRRAALRSLLSLGAPKELLQAAAAEGRDYVTWRALQDIVIDSAAAGKKAAAASSGSAAPASPASTSGSGCSSSGASTGGAGAGASASSSSGSAAAAPSAGAVAAATSNANAAAGDSNSSSSMGFVGIIVGAVGGAMVVSALAALVVVRMRRSAGRRVHVTESSNLRTVCVAPAAAAAAAVSKPSTASSSPASSAVLIEDLETGAAPQLVGA